MSTAVILTALSAAVTHAQLATDAAERLADQLVEERSLSEPPVKTIAKTSSARQSLPTADQPVPIITPKVRAPEPKRLDGPPVLLSHAEEPITDVDGGWDVPGLDLDTQEVGAGATPVAVTNDKNDRIADGNQSREVAGSIPGDDINEDGWDVGNLGLEDDVPGWEVDDMGSAPSSDDYLAEFNRQPVPWVANLIATREPEKVQSAVEHLTASGGVWNGSCGDFITAVRTGFSRRSHPMVSIKPGECIPSRRRSEVTTGRLG